MSVGDQRSATSRPGAAVVGVAGVLGVWWMVSLTTTQGVLPSPGTVAGAVMTLAGEEGFWSDVRDSFLRVALGTTLSLFIGTVLGVLGGTLERMRSALHPVMVLMESVPPIAWIVLAILWFHIGSMPSLAAAVASATPIAFLHTVEGVRDIDRGHLEMAAVYGLDRRTRLRAIQLPAVVPVLVATLSTTFAMNWRVVIMAEALSSYTGLGQGLWGSYLFGDMVTVLAYVVVIATLGLVSEYLILDRLKQRMMRHHR